MTRSADADRAGRQASKRQRTSLEPLNGKSRFATASNPREAVSETPLERFKAWAIAQSIEVDPRLDLRLQGDGVSWGISVHAGASLQEDEVMVTIPKTAVISRQTSALASHLTDEWRSESSQTVGLELALCLLYERCLGNKSRFEPFISILPRLPVELPMLADKIKSVDDSAAKSTAEHLPWAWIAGTEADRLYKRSLYSFNASSNSAAEWPWDHDYGMCKAMALDYFENVGIPVLEQSGLFTPTQCQHLDGLASAFLTAYTHVSSRDFIVDTYHGVGLVPVADLFNHTEQHNVQFEADQEVCQYCGIAFLTGHTEASCQDCSSSQEDVQADGKGMDEEEDIYGPDTLDIRTLTRLELGQEMYNSYGALSNALLLSRYGFCLDTETNLERYVIDLRFPDERAELTSALHPSCSDADAALQSTLAYVLSSTRSDQNSNGAALAGEDANDSDDDLRPELVAERDGVDGLHALDRMFASSNMARSPLNSVLCPLFRTAADQSASSEGEQELATPDEDTIDRDIINPLFVNATGSISTVLFALVFLIHQQTHSSTMPKRSDELRPLLTSIICATDFGTNTSVSPAALVALRATIETLSLLLERRLNRLYIFANLDMALELLHPTSPSSDSKVPYTIKACIQHAYQEFAALRASIGLLKDFRSSIMT